MRKLFSISALVLMLSSCGWGSLVGDEMTGRHSVLSEAFSSVAVLPPFGAKATITAENSAYTVLVTWDSTPNAKEYEVEVTGDYKKTEKVDSAQYSFAANLGKASSFNAQVTIKAINVNGVASAKSTPLLVTFGADSVYSEVVHDLKLSKGTETSVKIEYSPAKGADRYKLERRLSGAPAEEPWELLDAGIVNVDLAATRYTYLDQTAKSGYCYDYRIAPVDAGGIVGRSRVQKNGFIWPIAKDLRAGQGGEGVYDSQKGLFYVEWQLQSKLLGYNDTEIQDDILSSVITKVGFDVRIASSASSLDNRPAQFPKNWKTLGFEGWTNYDGSNFSGFTPPSGWDAVASADLYMGGATVYKKTDGNICTYRFYVVVDGSTHSDTNQIYERKAFLQVRPSYGKENPSMGMPWSNKALGYIVAKTNADIFSDKDIGLIDEGNGSVTVSWGSGADKYNIYVKKDGEAEYALVGEGVTGTNFTVTDLAPGDYRFGVAGVNASGDVGIIYESNKETVGDLVIK